MRDERWEMGDGLEVRDERDSFSMVCFHWMCDGY